MVQAKSSMPVFILDSNLGAASHVQVIQIKDLNKSWKIQKYAINDNPVFVNDRYSISRTPIRAAFVSFSSAEVSGNCAYVTWSPADQTVLTR